MTHATVNTLDGLGSIVYESAIVALGLEEGVARSLLGAKLATLGIPEAELDIETLGALLPQIDSTLRMALPPSLANEAMGRLTRFVLHWDPLDER